MAQDNPYAKYLPQTPQASPPPADGPAWGPAPKPDKPDAPKTTYRPMTPDEVAARGLPPGNYQVSSEGKVDPIGDVADPLKAEKAARAQEESKGELARIIKLIDNVTLDAADNAGWGETGFTGAALRSVPGTAAKGLASTLSTIDANAAFSKLQQMRENSPTGGALGNVTEKELDLLKSSVASLDPDQSLSDFVGATARAKKVYLDMLRRLDPAAADALNKGRGIRFDENNNPTVHYTDGEDSREPLNPFGVTPNGSPPPPSDGGGGGIMQGFASGVGDLVQGAGDTLGIIGNPINATINAVAGTNLSTDLGKTLRDASGLPDNTNPTASAINRGAVGALGLAGVAKGGAQIATSAPVRNALANFATSPIRDGVAGGAAGLGADIGRRNELGPAGEVGGALIGGLAGYKAAGMVGPRGGGNALAGAMDRQGVNLLPADTGGTASKIITTGAKASPLSSGPIRSQARQNVDDLSGAVERAAGGTRLTSDKAGEAISGAAKRYGKDSRKRGEVMYDRAFSAAKGVKIKPANTIAAIDDQLARLKENPADNSSVIKELESLRGNIADGVSIQGLRDARSQLSQGVYDGKLRSGADKARWQQVLGNIADDIDKGLRSVGRDGAANQFRRADDFWKGRVEHIDEVLEPLVGKSKGGEEVVKTIEAMARGERGGNARLSRLLGNMEPKEAAGVRATIITRLGKATAGAQDDVGGVFAPSTFLTNWNKMTPQAKASLFSDPAQRANLNDIALLASKMKATEGMANHSNTAMAVAGGGQAVGGIAVAAFLNPLLAVGAAGTQAITGQLMASPGFARILAKTAKMPNRAAQRSFMEQVKVLGTREPALRSDITALLERMGQAANQSPASRAAANDQEK